MLVDVPRLVTAYYTDTPGFSLPEQRVAFGTSGHRGPAFASSFNEWHVRAISPAICDSRKRRGIGGPLLLGIDTHALSVPACASALEVAGPAKGCLRKALHVSTSDRHDFLNAYETFHHG